MRSSGVPSLVSLVALVALVALGSPMSGALVRPAHADDSAPPALPEFLASPPALPPGYDEQAAWRLGLSEALQMAMQQNLGITVDRKGIETARLNEEIAGASMYEPNLSASYSHDGSSQPVTLVIPGGPGTPGVPTSITTRQDNWQLSLSQGLPTGALLSLGLNAGSSGSRSAATPPTPGAPGSHSSQLTFSLSQPVLRGFSTDLVIPRYAILTAKIASEKQRHQLEIAITALVQKTESAYWGVVSALYAYNVQVQAQKLAEDQTALVRRKIAAGMLSPSDLTGAENTLAQQKLTVLQGEAAVEAAWDALRDTLSLPRDQWSRPILPTDRPRPVPVEPMAPEQALEAALEHRPEIAMAGLDLRSSELALRKARNDALPRIDLGITGTLSGQGDGYGGAFQDLGRSGSRDWSVTAGLSWTPLGRANRANRELSRIAHEITVTSREILVQDIWNQVRGAVRRQHSAALQVAAARQSLTLAASTLEIENRRYLDGSSSNLAIAQLQHGLVDAEVAELQALIENESAQAALLAQRHIHLDVAPRP